MSSSPRAGSPYNPNPDVVPEHDAAQQLTELARDLGRHAEVHDRLMDAYWARRRTSATRTCCARLAGELGLPADEVEEVLGGDRYRDRIVDSTRQAASIGANAVPAFLLDRRLLVLGAQPNEVFEHAFAQLEERHEHPLRRRARRTASAGSRTSAMHRTSHALAVDGRVWLIDPIDGDGVEERVRALGEPAGVIQLIDRHNRDCAALAARLGVPLHVVPASLPETPFRFLPRAPLPLVERGRALVAGAPHPRLRRRARHAPVLPAGDEPAGLHPFFRLKPPRALRGLDVEHLLVGHGEGIHGEAAAAAVEQAVRTAGAGSRAGWQGSRASCARGY